jgi:hypothetical protein
MKYVVEQNQVVQIDGTISKMESPYQGEYQDDDIMIVRKFLQFRAYDGLNYENIEARYSNLVLISINITLPLHRRNRSGNVASQNEYYFIEYGKAR